MPRALSILLIDDSPEDVAYTRLLIEREGLGTCITCGTGAAGLAAWAERRPDCLIVDFHLPDMDGSEVIETLQRQRAAGGQRSAVVLLTGSSEETHAAESLASGAHEVLHKSSLSGETLRASINNARHRLALEMRVEHQDAERAQMAARMDLMVDGAELGWSDWDLRTDRVVWGGHHRRIFGVSDDAPVDGDTFFRCIHPDDREPIRGQGQAALAAGTATRLEFRVVWLDGTIRWINARGRVEHDHGGPLQRMIMVVYDITAAKDRQVELERQMQELAEQRALTEALMENAPVGIALLDTHLRYQRVNSCLAEISGISVAQHIGKPLHGILGDEDVERSLREVLQHGRKRVNFEYTQPGVEHPSHFLMTHFPVHLAGRLIGVGAIVNDVSERQRATHALAKREHLLSSIILAVPAVVYIFDVAERRARFVSDRAAVELGYPLTDIGTPSWLADILHPEDHLRMAAHLASFVDLPLGTIREFSYRLRHRDSSWRTYRSRDSLMERGPDGQAVLLGIAQDITDELRIEADLRRQESLYRTLAELMPCIVFAADPQGQCVFVNREWHAFTGDGSDSWRGSGWADRLHPDDRAATSAAWARCLDTGEAFSQESRLMHVNGEYRWMFSSAAPVRDENSRILEWVGVSHDIHDRVQLEHRLRRSNEDLDRFALMASHDLHAPLRVVCNFVGLLERRFGEKLDAKGGEWLRLIADATQRMRRMLDDLLNFARVDVTTEARPTSLEEALDQALLNVGAAVSDAGATIHREPLPDVLAHSGLIARVFQNLIGNALKYRGAAPPVIRIAACNVGGQVEVSVTDNGEGFPADQAERIFQLFERAHVGTVAGTGLGLAMCRRIIDAFGGRIWATGQPGAGATFSFSLARAADEERPKVATTGNGPHVERDEVLDGAQA